jgi:DNA-directed RNA polymerase specialized sigma subunit
MFLSGGLSLMIKDRSLIKFRTVALQPGLLSNIRRYYEEQEYIQKPELDEQQLEYLNGAICESMEHRSDVTITYYNKNHLEMILGKIHHFDEMKRLIGVIDKFDECQLINIGDIINIQ